MKIKIATRYLYENNSNPHNPGKILISPGNIVTKNHPLYKLIEGDEMMLNDLGKLYIAVDKMLYDFSNQWEDGMNPYDFLEDVIKAMKGEE